METEKELRVSPQLRAVRLDVVGMDTCFILVAPFDIFGRGLYRYTFEGQCRECPDLRLKDGAVRVFINTKGSNKIKLIHKNVQKVKASEKMGVKLMQRWEELVYEREEGCKEGSAKTLIETCQEFGLSKSEIKSRLVQKLEITQEDAAGYLEKFYIKI